MPVYEFECMQCASRREVLADWGTAKDLELLCIGCGGVMRINEVFVFNPGQSSPRSNNPAPKPVKACAHTHHCRCAIKMDKPNPFQDRIDAALGRAHE